MSATCIYGCKCQILVEYSLLQIWFLMTRETCIISSHTMQTLTFLGKPRQSKPPQISSRDLKEGFRNMKGNLKEKERNKKKRTIGSRADCNDFCSNFPSTFRNVKKHISYFPYGKRAEYKSFHFVSTTQLLLTRSQLKYLK